MSICRASSVNLSETPMAGSPRTVSRPETGQIASLAARQPPRATGKAAAQATTSMAAVALKTRDRDAVIAIAKVVEGSKVEVVGQEADRAIGQKDSSAAGVD